MSLNGRCDLLRICLKHILCRKVDCKRSKCDVGILRSGRSCNDAGAVGCCAAARNSGDWVRKEVPLTIVHSHGEAEQTLAVRLPRPLVGLLLRLLPPLHAATLKSVFLCLHACCTHAGGWQQRGDDVINFTLRLRLQYKFTPEPHSLLQTCCTFCLEIDTASSLQIHT